MNVWFRRTFFLLGNFGKNLALASIPFGLSALANKALAKDITATPATPIGALQFALTLEYLENEFYAMALDSGVIPASENGGRDLKVFQQIAAHENPSCKIFNCGIRGEIPRQFLPKTPFLLYVGALLTPFFRYPTFLALAQAFEDTGVRAYKGQAANLITTPDLLTAALQIHSVEARHASNKSF
ncbi:ferritin-like domain-containing protein [Flavobacterium procerum]|uniref:ferritin-like domain-containing protein n=1 Tax=Flavobacterium procerum TaxID=1455569 RepID=UPI0035E47510